MRSTLIALTVGFLALPTFARADPTPITSFDVEFVRNATNGPSSDLGTITSSTPGSFTFGGYNCTANVSLSGNQISVAMTKACSINAQDFGGLEFTDLTGGTSISGASTDPSSTLAPYGITTTSSVILVNLQGQNWNSGQTALVDFTTPNDVSATPEPGSFALLGTGLLGMAGVVRRRSLKA